MGDAARMRPGEPFTRLEHVADGALDRKWSLFGEHFGEPLALDVIHHRERADVRIHANFEQPHNVVAYEAQARPRGALEPADDLGLGVQLGAEKLDRSGVPEIAMPGGDDDGHRTDADRALDNVVVYDSALRERGRHGQRRSTQRHRRDVRPALHFQILTRAPCVASPESVGPGLPESDHTFRTDSDSDPDSDSDSDPDSDSDSDPDSDSDSDSELVDF
jgi:hypothetical protein